MKKIKLAAIALVILMAACKQKSDSDKTAKESVKTENTNTTEKTGEAKNPANTTTSEIEQKASPEAVAKVETILAQKALSPKEVLEEMNKLLPTEGITALKAAMCSQEKMFLDSTIAAAKRIEKALEVNMMGMIDENMSNATFTKEDFEFGKEVIKENDATLEITDKKTKKKQTLNFVKENGNWKFCQSAKTDKKEQAQMLAMLDMQAKQMESATPEVKKKQKEFFQQMFNSIKQQKEAKKATKSN